jgi:hypothetical protein
MVSVDVTTPKVPREGSFATLAGEFVEFNRAGSLLRADLASVVLNESVRLLAEVAYVLSKPETQQLHFVVWSFI